jgi:hypothetical protein
LDCKIAARYEKKKLKKKKATDPHQKELKKLGQLDLSWR